MGHLLNVGENVYMDNSIVSLEYHTYQPYASNSLNHNDEIRIPIQTQNLITLPCQSFLIIEGKLLNNDKASKDLHFVNNGVLFCFDEIRYSLGGTVIDRVRNPGITCTLKGYASFTPSDCSRLQNAGWSHLEHPKIVGENGDFNVCIPLDKILGFGEDFRKVILNTSQELILIRSNSDLNASITNVATEVPKIIINKIIWKMPHLSLSDSEKLKMYDYLGNSEELNIPFRSWELHEYPLLQKTKQHTWTVKTSGQLEKPRYILFSFQEARKDTKGRDMSYFDPCALTNCKLYLNSEVYPYDNLNLDFDNKKCAILYEMYARFQESYYYKPKGEPCFTPLNYFQIAPIVVIDCSRQNENLKNGAVDIRLEFETSKNIPDNTSAYCLILHDKLVKYNPLTNTVRII